MNLSISKSDLDQRSRIFNQSTRPLNKYEMAMNDASRQLCKADASLITNRQLLLEKARKVVHDEGYAYKKKKSRSGVFGEKAQPKRSYLTNDIRQARICTINLQIKSIEESISLLEKQKVQYINTKRFLQAAEVNTLIAEKRNSKAMHMEELRKLNSGASHRKRKNEESHMASKRLKEDFFSKAGKFHVEIDLDAQEADTLSESSDVEAPKAPQPCSDTSKEVTMTTTDEAVPALDDVEQVSNPPLLAFKKTEYEKYVSYTSQRLSEGTKVSCDLMKSKITDLSLTEFISARKAYCSFHHSCRHCEGCKRLTCMASDIVEKGIVRVPVLYRKHFKSSYKADKAVRVMMQLPVTIFRHEKQLCVTEIKQGLNMKKFSEFLSTMVKPERLSLGIDKDCLKVICELASSEKDRKLIQVAAGNSLSGTSAERELGIANFNEKRNKVNTAIEELQQIKIAVNDIVDYKLSSSLPAPDLVAYDTVGHDSENYLAGSLKQQDEDRELETKLISEEIGNEATNFDIDPFLSKSNSSMLAKEQAAQNTTKTKDRMRKQTAREQRLKKRLVAKKIIAKRLLQRKLPKKVSKTLQKYPDLGKDIKDFARANRIGAASWRRTGLLTFDGNTKKGPKLTYMRIKKHLEEKYQTTFGYGTIVQLCCSRNKRHLSSKRYWRAANIKSRRARKGFNVKLNVDAHWSCSFYQLLNHLQLKDGTNKFIVNRDDAAGFRLDTTYTHKQHKLISNIDQPELTTRTDYVNRYPSILQTSSYLVMGTENTPEQPFGIVKATGVFQKNAGQHSADFIMLQQLKEFAHYFENKPVECFRVDGAGNENPGFDEVQFHWAERHMLEGRYCTLVTTRYAGGSYLNRVELLNGCLSMGHSGIFIPSTIHGSNMD